MTTDPAAIAARKRKLRRRHKRERQAVIFGGVLAGLAAVGLGAAAVWTGSMDGPFDRDFTTASASPSATTAAVPCVPADTLPVAYGSVSVTVFNATARPGLAGSVADLLGQRGFSIEGTDNYSIKLRSTARIGFGAQGIAEAYTLAAHLSGATLVYDDRTDDSIDLAVGSAFTDLVPLDLVALAADEPLRPVSGCVPLTQAEAVPAPTRTAQADEDAESDDDADEGAEDPPADEDEAGTEG